MNPVTEIAQLLDRTGPLPDGSPGHSQTASTADGSVTVLEPAQGDHIDRSAEQVLEVVFEAYEIEQGASHLELHQEVDIALGCLSCRDTEPHIAIASPR